MVGKAGTCVPVVVIRLPLIHGRPTSCLSPLMVGKTGSSVPVILTYLHVFDTPHGREDWVECPSDTNVPI